MIGISRQLRHTHCSDGRGVTRATPPHTHGMCLISSAQIATFLSSVLLHAAFDVDRVQLSFARSRELIGCSDDDGDVSIDDVGTNPKKKGSRGSTDSDLLSFLVHAHPPLKSIVKCAILMLNEEFVADGDESTERRR